jgi:hypothetical protein
MCPYRETPISSASTHSLVIYLSLKVPSKRASLHVCQQGPCGCTCRLQSQWFICSFLSVSEPAIKESSHANRQNISPFLEAHADRIPTYSGVRPGSPRGSLTTLQSLPQHHAALNTIPSTLAWVDQSSATQHVS